MADAPPITLGQGAALLPVAQFETRGRVLNIERFKPYQSLGRYLDYYVYDRQVEVLPVTNP